MSHRFVAVPRSASSPKCFALARKWLSICRERHTACQTLSQHFVPRRLIEIKNTTVRLCEDLAGPIAYVALSHCWGSTQPLKTMSTTLEAHRNGLLFHSLPRTFQDAVTVARKLGFDYIWIDSLCIIQDNKTDWEEQSSQMAYVYRGAELVLGATMAGSSDAGFLQNRDTTPEWKLSVELQGRRTPMNLRYRVFARGEHGVTGPLEHRAWAYQERVLARRFLAYGKREMVWDCVESDACECDCVLDSSPTDIFHVKNIEKMFSETDVDDLMTYWREHVLRQYSLRSLTEFSDKLVALSAVAAVFQAKTGGTYLAGLWSQDLLRQLTWHFQELGRVLDFYAPSWSWVSVDNFWIGYWDSTCKMDNTEEVARVMEIDVRPATGNPFGPVAYGMIKLRGRYMPATLSSSNSERVLPYSITVPNNAFRAHNVIYIDTLLATQLNKANVLSVRRAFANEATTHSSRLLGDSPMGI